MDIDTRIIACEPLLKMEIRGNIAQDTVTLFKEWISFFRKANSNNCVCFFDLPCTNETRMIQYRQYSPAGNTLYGALIISYNFYESVAANIGMFYRHLYTLLLNNDPSMFSPAPLSLPFSPDQKQSEFIQTSNKELSGLQIIGDPLIGLNTVSSMLAGVPVKEWFKSFSLAVNPVFSSSSFSCVVSQTILQENQGNFESAHSSNASENDDDDWDKSEYHRHHHHRHHHHHHHSNVWRKAAKHGILICVLFVIFIQIACMFVQFIRHDIRINDLEKRQHRIGIIYDDTNDSLIRIRELEKENMTMREQILQDKEK